MGASGKQLRCSLVNPNPLDSLEEAELQSAHGTGFECVKQSP